MSTPDIISPKEIQSELDRIWESLEGSNKSRASLFNLIFYTEKRDRAEYIHTIAQKVIEKYPSRIIFITADEKDGGDFLNTRVSVIPAGGDIACDLIEIDVGREAKQRLPFVILPHLLPDLPIYVIWGEDPAKEEPLFSQLQKLANRMIFDSETTEDFPRFAKTLLHIKEESGCDIADLNWARIESWRNLLSSTFYREDSLEKLRNATEIQILYNTHETPFYCHTQTQALYLQGWLAAQLHWERKETKDGQLFYDRTGGNVNIALYPEKLPSIKPGSVISLDITTADNCHFSFGRDLRLPHQISMRFATAEQCTVPLKYLFEKAESGQSLVREIGHKGTSAHFMNLLGNIKGLCGF